jgi:hypothetical protein
VHRWQQLGASWCQLVRCRALGMPHLLYCGSARYLSTQVNKLFSQRIHKLTLNEFSCDSLPCKYRVRRSILFCCSSATIPGQPVDSSGPRLQSLACTASLVKVAESMSRDGTDYHLFSSILALLF